MATNGRLRDYLTRDEVRALLCAVKKSKRYAARNHAMILLAYRHGLRASELVELRVCDVDFRAGTIHCRRRKGSNLSVHPMMPDELRAIGRVMRDRPVKARDYLFCSERGAQLTRYGFWRVVSEAPVATSNSSTCGRVKLPHPAGGGLRSCGHARSATT